LWFFFLQCFSTKFIETGDRLGSSWFSISRDSLENTVSLGHTYCYPRSPCSIYSLCLLINQIPSQNLWIQLFLWRNLKIDAALTCEKITTSFGNSYHEYLFHLPRIQNFLSHTKLCSEWTTQSHWIDIQYFVITCFLLTTTLYWLHFYSVVPLSSVHSCNIFLCDANGS
jgi:hypothetical protein